MDRGLRRCVTLGARQAAGDAGAGCALDDQLCSRSMPWGGPARALRRMVRESRAGSTLLAFRPVRLERDRLKEGLT